MNEALHEALKRDHLVVVQLFLKFGADLNRARYDDDETLLHRVAWQGSGTAAKYLLDHGLNIEAVSAKGDRPIHESLDRHNWQEKGMVELFLERGADVNAYGPNEESPLIIVSKQGQTNLVRLLLDRGADTLAKR